MSIPSEAEIENNLIDQLMGLGYERAWVRDADSLLSNLKIQLETFNQVTFSEREFSTILNHLEKGNVFDKAKTLRDRFLLVKDDDSYCYVRFFNSEDWRQNHFQVTNQVQQQGAFLNRYDVTLLVNGLPLVQIELKRQGTEIKEAFNQINRYQKHSFWSNHGLFQYVQCFVVSNKSETRYLANNELQSLKQAFFWAAEDNRNIKGLEDFAQIFLDPDHLGKMIARYVVMNEAGKIMMILRPYQYHAAEAIIRQVSASNENGYIWHTTGSGKTLTSFKASQVVMNLPQVHKVVFVVDRKDLDYQTMREFNAYKKDSVDGTDNTQSLITQLSGDAQLVVTTIQKLNNAIADRHGYRLQSLRDKKLVFIFDECHRSQFGHTHGRITSFFAQSQLFGFTGTPILAENAAKNELGKRTTRDLFGNCLHKYVITDAIRDQNVLRFGIEYIGKYKNKSNTFIDIEVEDIDRAEVLDWPVRLEKIADYILAYHDQKTKSRMFSALFAVSSIDNAIRYYDIFQKKKQAGEHDLRIATVFTFGPNSDEEGADDDLPDTAGEYNMAAEPQRDPSDDFQGGLRRDKLERYIADYNQLYGTAFTTRESKQFEKYATDISKRLKEREKKNHPDSERLDLVIVVNMMLTGFDAKMVNTLYVDRPLKQHGLIQAFSRTNRIKGELKSQGNILCFRNLKKATDDAITLFSNKEAIEVVTMPDYEVIAARFDAALKQLRDISPTYQQVDELLSEDDEAAFVLAFRRVMRSLNVLQSYTDFSWDDLTITEEEYTAYLDKYLGLKDKVDSERQKEKVSILNDIDFELELIHRDKINVAYILKLLARLKAAKTSEVAAQKKAIIDLMGGDLMLRSKRELIEQFIEENLPKISDAEQIQDAFEKYWEEQKVLALAALCEEENLDQAQFKALIDAYIFTGQEPIRDDVFKCLDNRPSILQARSIGERILARMKAYVQTFVNGMTG